MQIAYFDCISGISGDMTLSALIDAGADLAGVENGIASLGLGRVKISFANTVRKGFRGKLLSIDHPQEHAHRYLRDILTILRRGDLTPQARDLAMRFFERLARAEAKVHGTSIDRVQFHEVGAIDSIVDMVGVAIAWDSLQLSSAYASAVPTGTGQIRIAHGVVNVPAPATAELLLGVPIASTQIATELTTPTGAAILTELVQEFGPMPAMQVSRIGYGAGNKDFPDRPNLLRVLIGDAIKNKPTNSDADSVLVLECNLDDVPGEQIGFAIQRLWKAGALDVFATSIQMKKNRPGTLLTVISKPEDRRLMESILFQQTGTLGIRYRRQARTVLPRATVDVSSPWGVVSGKVSMLPTGEVDFSPEFDDCSRIAAEHGLRLVDVVTEIRECYYATESKREFQSVHSLHENHSSPSESPRHAWESTPSIPHAATTAFDAPDPHLESINTVFQELASEEQSGPPESTSHSLGDSAEEETAYYRWDSSPWTREPSIEPLAPPAPPRPFPIEGSWDLGE
jgi:uncharacterized protein (TIGR00299 family) protein